MLREYMRKLFRLFRGGNFVKNVLTLMTGTVSAQAITILISPILTRLYSPADFGNYGFYIAIVSILSIIAAGGYESAIMLPDSEDEACSVFTLAISISLFLSTGILFIASIFLFIFPRCTPAIEYSNWAFYISLSVMLNGLFQTLNYWFNRKMQYKLIAKARFTQAFFTALLNIMQGYYKASAEGLILGSIIGQGLAVGFLVKKFLQDDGMKVLSVQRSSLRCLAKKYSVLLKYGNFNSLLNSFSNQVPVLFLTRLFSPTVAGHYLLSHRVVSMPMSTVCSSFSQVFFQQAAATINGKKSLYNLLKITYTRLFLIGFVPFTIVGLLAPHIFALFFGTAWRTAGEYTQILIPWLFLMFLNSPVSSLITVVKKQKAYLKYEVSLLVARVSVLLAGYEFLHNSYWAIVMFSVVGFCFNVVLIIWLLRISKLADSMEVSLYG